MKLPRRSALILSVTLVLLGACKEDNKPVTDPLEDPWVDAIEADDEEPTAVASAEALPAVEPNAGEPQPLALAEPTTPPEAPAAGVLASPSNPAEPTTARDSGSSVSAPTTTPAEPTAEAPAVDGQPPAPEPAPAVEPKPPASAEPAKPASPPPITAADFNGSYRYVGGSSQRDDLDEALDATVDALARAIQGIARKRLAATNPVESTVDIVVVGDKVTTTFESGVTATCTIDGGTATATDIEGGKLKVRLRAKDGKLVQQMEGKGGARTIVYVLSADRSKLTVHHKITSDRLPVPLTYRFSYSRK